LHRKSRCTNPSKGENKNEVFNPKFDYSKLVQSDEIHDLDDDSTVFLTQIDNPMLPQETDEMSFSNANVSIPIHIIIKDSNYDMEMIEADSQKHLNQEIKVLPWLQNPDTQNKATFTGPVDDSNRPHGRGILQYENGDTYEGPFFHGLRHGSDGIWITHQGTMVYIGEFRDNWKHGHGTQKSIADECPRYTGGYCKGLPHGYGVGYHKDGSVFHKGQWDYGKPSHQMVPLMNDSSDPKDLMSVGSKSTNDVFRIPMACDESLESTLGPRVSRYDPFKRRIPSRQDDSSTTSDSCVSEVTFISSDFYMETSQDMTESFPNNSFDTSSVGNSSCSSRKKGTTKLYAQNSILGLGRSQNQRTDHTSLFSTNMEYDDDNSDWDPINVYSQIIGDTDHDENKNFEYSDKRGQTFYQISSLPGFEQEI
jgi:hypothetical protein